MANLESVSADHLREVLTQIDDSDATMRVAAALVFVEVDDFSQNRVAELFGFSSGWASEWFRRLERLAEEPFEDVVYDDPRSGRPPELSEQEQDQFEEAVNESPEESGIDEPAWSVDRAREYLRESFGVEYCPRHVRRLLTAAGLSWKTARPQFHKGDERAQAAFREGFKQQTEALDEEYTIIAMDQTRQLLSKLTHAWFPEDERPSIPVKGKWESLKLLGGVTDGGDLFCLPCEDTFNSDLTIRWLDALQQKFGEKICVVLDNASYFRANKVQDYADGTAIELCYLPRGSPELNPAEECWRQLGQELGNQIFDDLDELRDVVLGTLGSLDPPDVFNYLYP
jgi:transposase